MATATELKTLKLKIETNTADAVTAFSAVAKAVEGTAVSIRDLRTSMQLSEDGVEKYTHYLQIAARTVEALQQVQSKLSKGFLEVSGNVATSDVTGETRATQKRREEEAAKAFKEESDRRKAISVAETTDMVARTRAAITEQVSLNREGANSINAIKAASAEKQREIEENLKAKLKSIQDRYINQEISSSQLNLGRNASITSYKRQTLALTEETDKRIAKIREEEAAEKLAQDAKAARARYATQQIKEEAAELARVRQRELQDLKAAMEQQSTIRSTANRQMMENTIYFAEEARKRELAILKRDIQDRSALMAQAAQQQSRTFAQIMSSSNFRPSSDSGLAMIRGMTQSARTPVPQTSRSSEVFREVPQAVTRSHENLLIHVGKLIISYQTLRAVLGQAWQGITSIPRIGIELDSVRASLEATMGSSAGAAGALKALDAEAQRTGINVNVLRENFKNFQASTSLAGQSLESTWRMFTNLNTVITGLHLSADKANGIFIAMAQIFNKSKVQSEELVKQLGNLLPGAFASMAASMKILPEELAKRMKEGTVYAKDVMENFIAFMKDRFAPAFVIAAEGLNANIGRMYNSFTKLGEAIYASSSGPMNSFVKGVAEMTDHVTRLVTGVDQLSEAFKVGLKVAVGLVAIEFAALAIKILEASAAINAIRVAAMALGGPVTAAIAVMAGGFAYFVSEANKGRDALEDLRAVHDKVLERQVEIDKIRKQSKVEETPLEVKVSEDPLVVGINKDIEDAKKKLENLKKQGDVFSENSMRSSSAAAIARGQADIKALETQKKSAEELAKTSIEAERLAEKERIATASKISLSAITEKYTANLGRYAKTAEEARAFGEKSIKTATWEKDFQTVEKGIDAYTRLEKLQAKIKEEGRQPTRAEELDIATTPDAEKFRQLQITKQVMLEDVARGGEAYLKQFNEKGKKEADKAASERLKGFKEEGRVFQEYQKTAANDAKNQIAMLDSANKAKILSFEEYARRKQEILDKDYNDEKSWYEKQKALAEQSGKKDLIAKANEQLKRLEDDYQSKSKVAGDETTARMNDYETNLASIHQQYQDILGIERDSVEITKTKLEILNRQIEAEIKEGGEVGKTASLRKEELEILIEARNLKAKMAIYDKETATAEKIHTDAISRINQLEQVGQMSSLSAAMARTKANERLLEIRQKDVDLAKQALDEARPGARPAAQDKYDIAKQKLESLKLVANETGAMIEQSLSNAFDRSFQGLITNTMTAKQAFKSFATSIVEDIARIIAQEVRSAILRPMLRMGLSALGGLFTSSVPDVAPTPTVLTAANGGVFSGAGISAHSGTIVDRPTLFPFAKGGGLMGEAGPEAILPLKRNSQGKLGVSVDNTGQPRGSNIYYINTTVNAKSDASPTDIAAKASETIMRAIAKQEINSAARPGNKLNQVTKYGY